MEIEDSNLLQIFQIPPNCSNECLEQFFVFVRETMSKGLRLTVMVKRPVDISARVQAAMEKRRRKLLENRSPEEIIQEKKDEIKNIIKQADESKGNGDFIQAVQQYMAALNLNAQFSEEIEINAYLHIQLGYSFQFLNDLDNATEYQDKSVAIIGKLQEPLLEKFKIHITNFLISKMKRQMDQGDILLKDQKYEDAILEYMNALQICKRVGGQDQDILQIYKQLGLAYENSKKQIESSDYYELALKMVADQIDQQILILHALGRVKQDMGDLDKTVLYWDQCIQILKKKDLQRSIDDSILMEKLLFNIGIIHFQKFRVKESISPLEEAVNLGKQIFGLEDIRITTRLSALGDSYKARKEWDKALEQYTVAMQIKKKYYEESPNVSLAKTIMQVGQMLMQLGKFEPAKNQLTISLSLYTNLDKNQENQQLQLNRANLMMLISDCYKEMVEPEGALTLLENCLKIRKQYLSIENQQTQQTMLTLIRTYFNLSETAKAFVLLLELEVQQEKQHGLHSTIVGQSCSNIAIAATELKQFDKAILFSRRAEQIFKKTSGLQDPIYKKAKLKCDEIKKLSEEYEDQQKSKLEEDRLKNKQIQETE